MDLFKYRIGSKEVLVYRSVYAPVKSNMFTLLTGKEAIVFDPNKDNDLLELLKEKGVEKVHICLTHGHYDHISGVMWLKDSTDATVYCQERCAERLMNSKRPLARLVALVLADEDKKDGGARYQDFKKSYKPFSIVADKTFVDSDSLHIGDLHFEITSTPGHSEGSSCYTLFDKMVFTGDTLLRDYPVILKFPGGNKEDFEKITLPYLKRLSKDSIIMPGHGDPFILKETKNI
jgi:glyoxylase-like metal-dependent hydrolase (beta-lactamase superfamily II)